MIKRFDIGSLRFTFSFSPVFTVTGVNSYVSDNLHILMWDFDNVTLEEVKNALKKVQTRYFLSDIHIAKTKEAGGYHAFCFTTHDWRTTVEILAATSHTDMKYLKWCLFRGRLTLRVGEKMGRISHKVATLEGYQLPDVTIRDLKSWVVYETIGGKEWWTHQAEKWQDKMEVAFQKGKEIIVRR